MRSIGIGRGRYGRVFSDVFSAAEQLGWRNSKGMTALRIFNDGGIQFGSFEVKNPMLSPSPIYINLRIPENGGAISKDTMDAIGWELTEETDNCIAGAFIVGIPSAGIPIEKSIFEFLGPPAEEFTASFVKQGSGDERSIVEFCPPVLFPEVDEGMEGYISVVIVDDVLSWADTKLEAAKAVEKVGYRVGAFAVCVDREQGGRDKLENMGYEVISVYTLSELLEFYVLMGLITEETKTEVMEYIERTKKIIGPT